VPLTTGVILARGGSKGIPRKNLMDFCGKPLLAWSIQQASASKAVDSVFVSSDDAEILGCAERFGASPILRPGELAGDRSSSEDALLHAVGHIEGSLGKPLEVVVFLQPTSPLRTPADIDEAVGTFTRDGADSLFSAATLDDCCIWKKDADSLESLTFDYRNRGRRQDRQPLYLENGSIYVFKPRILRECRNRLGGRISIHLMEYWKSYEIDKPEDVEICEFFMRKRILGGTDR